MSSGDGLYSLDSRGKLFIVLFSVASISRASVITFLIAVVLVPCGYLAVGAVIVVIAGPSPLTSVSVSPIIFWRSRTLVVACVFSVCESICYVHEV
jgi:hypothetical protein